MSDSTTPGSRLTASPMNSTQDVSMNSDEANVNVDGMEKQSPVGPDLESVEPAFDDTDRAEVAAFRNLFEAEEPGQALVPLSDDDSGTHLRHGSSTGALPPGPGIPEAVAWTFGVLAIHFIGSVIAMLVIVVGEVLQIAAAGTPPSEEVVRELQGILPQLIETRLIELITIEMVIFFVAAMLATWLRLGTRAPYRLGIRPLALQHFLLIALVSIPIALMCGGLMQVTTAIWEQSLAHLPGMEVFEGMNVNEAIKPLGASAPTALLLLVIAVIPAIAEELIFRGIIGRGLVARHGVVAGVTMTSLMFAVVHGHPAHVVALLPLAFFLHLVYLTTRSIMAPMLLHLLNNSLAVILLKASATFPALEGASDPELPGYALLISAGIVGLVGWTLWRSRVQYRTQDGSLWDPGFTTIEIPPESAGASVCDAGCPAGLYRGAVGLAGVYSLIFVVSLGLMLSGQIPT